MNERIIQIMPGVFRFAFGTPEKITPFHLKERNPDSEGFQNILPDCPESPIPYDRIIFQKSARGCRIEIPKSAEEDIYGFGLQLKSLCQTNKKRSLRVNSDPELDLGDSHAPVPLYFSTAGYGIFIDTARYAVFYTGKNRLKNENGISAENSKIRLNESELYGGKNSGASSVFVDIPCVQGVELYLFGGPTMKDAIRRYVMFCGGGCLIPEWGLGLHYRVCGTADENKVLQTAEMLREERIPCDVIGLEPGWQSHAYPCSLAWSPERFPHHDELLKKLHEKDFHVNLWEHVFLHQESPLYPIMEKYSGDFEVFQGIVPDLLCKDAASSFGKYHREMIETQNIDAFKLDECDNSDFKEAPWSFPECAEFPSGCDGEQMHSMLGILYQQTIASAFHDSGKRTFGAVRNSHAFAPPLPFVLYSDLYDHKDFLRGMTTCGFGGMLWTPELRHAASSEDYRKRLISMILAPQFLMNIWSMPYPPWCQLDKEKNRAGIFYSPEEQEDLKKITRDAVELRMRFVPYLYHAFMQYHFAGIPPFRALVMEEPENVQLRHFDRAWFAGNDLIVAPTVAGENELVLPLPAGCWYEFETGIPHQGSVVISGIDGKLPFFVRENATIPLAEPVQNLNQSPFFQLTLRAYGPNPKSAELFADDGLSIKTSAASFGCVSPNGGLSENLKKRYEIKSIQFFNN